MAYAEAPKGTRKSWRVRYKLADGTYGSGSADDHGQPFTSKQAALDWGRDQEAQIRRGTRRDPSAGDATVADWIAATWWPSIDVGRKTESAYRWHIERHILPTWGERALNTLRTPEIAAWERHLRDVDGFSDSSAKSARTLLITILGDAVDAGLIDTNPAVRPRRRGRKTGKAAAKPARRAWLTPLEVLLLAERCAILSGRGDDFVFTVTIAWTGCRWGELVGMQRDCLHGDEWDLRWQIYHHSGRWRREPPKDDSARLVDLPPFLTRLLAVQAQDGAPPCRICPPGIHRPGVHVFGLHNGTTTIGGVERPAGGHPDSSGWVRHRWRAAADGWWPANTYGKRPRPSMPVLIDASAWPGMPLRPAWPAADPDVHTYERPSGRGIKRVPEDTPVASWLPIRTGLVAHGLRHGHKVWLDEDGIPEVLKRERLWGGQLAGIQGVYSHVSPDMRRAVKAALQRRWEDALRQRAAMCPTSPVPLLDELLKPHRAGEADRRAVAS